MSPTTSSSRDDDCRYDILKELGDCHAAICQYDTARAWYRHASRQAPHEPGSHVGLGVLAVQGGQLAQGKRCFELAARLDEGCSDAYSGLAMVHQHRQDYPAAMDMYLKCLQLDGDNLVALLGLFQTSIRVGSFAKIIHFLELYLQRHPGDVSVLFCLASLYARDGRLSQARDTLLDVLALDAGRTEAAAMLADVQSRLAGRPIRQQLPA